MAELSLLAKATIVLAAALLAARAAARAPASIRALVIASSFAVLIALPLAGIAMPPRPVEIPAASMPVLLQESVFDASLATAALQSAIVAPVATARVRMPAPAAPVRVACASGALPVAAPIVVALWGLRRMRTSGLPWLEGRTLVASVARQAGVGRGVDVFPHEALVAPM